jgi:hypothetical protein
MSYNVLRPREVVKPASRVVSAKIEFLRENQTRRNRKPTISRDRCWQMAISKNNRFFQNQAIKRIDFAQSNFGISLN